MVVILHKYYTLFFVFLINFEHVFSFWVKFFSFRISKYKNILAKGYITNCSEEVFVIKKVKNIVPWTYVIDYLNGEEIIGTFYEKELQ